MAKSFYAFIKLLLTLWVIHSSSAFAKLEDSYEKALLGSLNDSRFKKNIDDYHFIFVGGLGNEFAQKNYFRVTVDTIQQLGATQVHTYFPSSLRAVSDNLPGLRDMILRLFIDGGGRPIILVGHSKGGLEILALVLAYPELIERGAIARVVPIQAPLRGCHLGDLATKLNLLGRWNPFFNGTRSLQSHEINTLIDAQLLSLNSGEHDYLSRSILYVTSKQSVLNTARIWTPGSLIMDWIHSVESDGLVATHDMHVEGLGRVLGQLVADHTEVLIPPFRGSAIIGLSTSTVEKNKAFAKALVFEVLKDISSKRMRQLQDCRSALTTEIIN